MLALHLLHVILTQFVQLVLTITTSAQENASFARLFPTAKAVISKIAQNASNVLQATTYQALALV